MKLRFDPWMEKLLLIISKINDGIIRFSKWDLKEKKKSLLRSLGLFPRVNSGEFPKLNFLRFWFGLITDFDFIVSMWLSNKSHQIGAQSKGDLLPLMHRWVGRMVLKASASGGRGRDSMLNSITLVCLQPQLNGGAEPVSLTELLPSQAEAFQSRVYRISWKLRLIVIPGHSLGSTG